MNIFYSQWVLLRLKTESTQVQSMDWWDSFNHIFQIVVTLRLLFQLLSSFDIFQIRDNRYNDVIRISLYEVQKAPSVSSIEFIIDNEFWMNPSIPFLLCSLFPHSSHRAPLSISSFSEPCCPFPSRIFLLLHSRLPKCCNMLWEIGLPLSHSSQVSSLPCTGISMQ